MAAVAVVAVFAAAAVVAIVVGGGRGGSGQGGGRSSGRRRRVTNTRLCDTPVCKHIYLRLTSRILVSTDGSTKTGITDCFWWIVTDVFDA